MLIKVQNVVRFVVTAAGICKLVKNINNFLNIRTKLNNSNNNNLINSFNRLSLLRIETKIKI